MYGSQKEEQYWADFTAYRQQPYQGIADFLANYKSLYLRAKSVTPEFKWQPTKKINGQLFSQLKLALNKDGMRDMIAILAGLRKNEPITWQHIQDRMTRLDCTVRRPHRIAATKKNQMHVQQ